MSATWTGVVARRMARQGLIAPLPSISAAVAAMCGAHSQLGSAAELAIGARVAGISAADVRNAISQGTLVKTYGPRGTVHLLPREELDLWCGALSAAPVPGSMPKGVQLEDDELEAVLRAVADALAGPRPLDIDELGSAVVARVGPSVGELTMPAFGSLWPRWRQAVVPAAHRGILSFGPTRGSRVTFVSPGLEAVADPKHAIEWLALRYLENYGPATPQNFARWMAASPSWGAGVFDALGDAIERISVDGVKSFVVAGDTTFADEPVAGIRLLPHFDPYVVGSYPRESLFAGKAAGRALARGQAGNYPVVIAGGVVAGVWRAVRRSRSVELTVEFLAKPTLAQRGELREEAQRVGTFLGLEPTVVLAPVAIGPHA